MSPAAAVAAGVLTVMSCQQHATAHSSSHYYCKLETLLPSCTGPPKQVLLCPTALQGQISGYSLVKAESIRIQVHTQAEAEPWGSLADQLAPRLGWLFVATAQTL